MERIVQLYQSLTGCEPRNVVPLAASGSNRRYFRVYGAEELVQYGCQSIVAVVGTDVEENHSFISLAKMFKEHGLPVPSVYAVSSDGMVYLQEDCGMESLSDFIAKHRTADGYDAEAEAVMAEAVKLLPRVQFMPVVTGKQEDVFGSCYPQREMDRTSVMFDLNYFKYCFLKLKGVEFNELRLQRDLEAFADDLLAEGGDTFLYRDFQSRNVMLKDGKPYLIDFQGGRKGPIYYDVASFLWQSSACLPDDLRVRLIDEYLQALRPYREIERDAFIRQLHLFVLFRLLQVLGAYGYRGLWEKKNYFIRSIPLALDNLKKELTQGACDRYPYLKQVLETLVEARVHEQQVSGERLKRVGEYLTNDTSYCSQSTEPLVVQVYSFSFKKGIPADDSGNGGGYVFDCRSTHNPGRYDEYKPLTGLDKPVIDFLEIDGEILAFLDSVYRLVDFHVNRFMQRGFSHLQVCFGCTGGRHRSVYCAQHVAEHIHEKFGVEVRVCHREQGITQTFL